MALAPLTIKRPCAYMTLEQWNASAVAQAAFSDQEIPVGERVEYLGHVPGGMVKVRHGEQEVIIHPAATAELSD